MQRKNEAQWIASRNRWQINVQAEGKRHTFVNATPGAKGKIAAEKAADKWLSHGCADENTKVSVLLDMFGESIKSRSLGYFNNFDNFNRNYITPIIGAKKIKRLTSGDLQDVIDYAYSSKHLAKKTLKNLRGYLSSFLKFCRQHGYTTLLVEDLIIPASAKRSHKTILNTDSLKILFTVDTTEFRTVKQLDPFIWAYRFAVVTGLRPGELIGLMKKDIIKDKLTVMRSINNYDETTEGKNENARRTIKLSDEAKYILSEQEKMLKSVGIISKYIFPDNDGDYIRQTRFRKRWKRYCLVNGIEDAQTPYELRHTFVSITDEMPEALKKMVVGHSKNMDTEGVYGHRRAEDLDTAATYIDAALKKYIPENAAAK